MILLVLNLNRTRLDDSSIPCSIDSWSFSGIQLVVGLVWLYSPGWYLGKDAWKADLPWGPQPLRVDSGPL